jgi:hypothetical protein
MVSLMAILSYQGLGTNELLLDLGGEATAEAIAGSN